VRGSAADDSFEETVANAAILRLHTAALWAEEMKAAKADLRTGEFNEFDRGFIADMDALCEVTYEAFDRMEFKEALKRGLYDFEIARNWYRAVSNPENGGAGMHHDLVFDYIRRSALLIAPFTPHYSEHIYQNIVGEKGSIQTAAFPRASAQPNPAVIAQLEYMRGVVDSIRSAEALLTRKKGKGKAAGAYDPALPKSARVFVAKDFPEWQNKCVEIIKTVWDEETRKVDDAKLKDELVKAGLIKDKKAMPFVQTFKVGFGLVWYESVETDGAATAHRARPQGVRPVAALLRVRRHLPPAPVHQVVAQVREPRCRQRVGRARDDREERRGRRMGQAQGGDGGARSARCAVLECVRRRRRQIHYMHW